MTDHEHLQSVQTPGLLGMVVSVLEAGVKETKAIIKRDPPVSDDEYDRRLRLCRTCDLFDKKSERCTHCGCFMVYKAKMRSTRCPLGKW